MGWGVGSNTAGDIYFHFEFFAPSAPFGTGKWIPCKWNQAWPFTCSHSCFRPKIWYKALYINSRSIALMDLKKWKWASLCTWYVIFALFTHIFYIFKTDKILKIFSQFSRKFLQIFWGNRFTSMVLIRFCKSGFVWPLQIVIYMLFRKFHTNSPRSTDTKIRMRSHCLCQNSGHVAFHVALWLHSVVNLWCHNHLTIWLAIRLWLPNK